MGMRDTVSDEFEEGLRILEFVSVHRPVEVVVGDEHGCEDVRTFGRESLDSKRFSEALVIRETDALLGRGHELREARRVTQGIRKPPKARVLGKRAL